MNANYKNVLIGNLKSFDAKAESNVEKAVSLVAESIAMAYTNADLSVQEKTFLRTLKAIQENPTVLDIGSISTQETSSKMTHAIVEEILAYFKCYEFGIAEMESIANSIKA